MGLAQALVGNPPVLILDEPTVGLDPKQIIEIRALIKKLGKNHTVILSSHILPEIQAVCDKIVIINRGRVVANDSADHLAKNMSADHKLVIRCEGRSCFRLFPVWTRCSSTGRMSRRASANTS